jgi:glyoxylase-like metal-dependent hydrolase (beta-lactamase superfamily II)
MGRKNVPEKTRNGTGRDTGREIAPGVYCMEAGRGITRANVYFVRSGNSWVLIDAGLANSGQSIRRAAERLFGEKTKPACILLTHDHPDHAGAALELARIWNCKVYMHADELPIAVNPSLTVFKEFANPMDNRIILPMLRAMPRRRLEAMLKRDSLKEVARAFDPGTGVPNLPDWQYIFTPGHTPGHVAYYRTTDGVLITGDAIVTVNLNSFGGFLGWAFHIKKQKMAGPPRYSTWNWQTAKKSAALLAELEPNFVAPGHGEPLTGKETSPQLRVFARHFAGPTKTKHI